MDETMYYMLNTKRQRVINNLVTPEILKIPTRPKTIKETLYSPIRPKSPQWISTLTTCETFQIRPYSNQTIKRYKGNNLSRQCQGICKSSPLVPSAKVARNSTPSL